MRSIVKSPFLWQFAVGFALGTAGLVSLEPAGATHTLTSHFLSGRAQH